MPIVDHPTWRFDGGHDHWPESCKVVECDSCRTMARGYGHDHGEAADKARREGFATVRGKRLGDPMGWACPGCQPKASAAR